MITVYGISNCDTVRKARQWLEAHGIEYRFHDFREDGLAPEAVAAWIDELVSMQSSTGAAPAGARCRQASATAWTGTRRLPPSSSSQR